MQLRSSAIVGQRARATRAGDCLGESRWAALCSQGPAPGSRLKVALLLGSRLVHSQKATRVARATAERKLAASLS